MQEKKDSSLLNFYCRQFRPSLDAIGWPRQVSMGADFTEFISSFQKLLEFQFLYVPSLFLYGLILNDWHIEINKSCQKMADRIQLLLYL